MLNRLSVNVILKSVITLLMSVIVLGLAAGAWESWTRLAATNRIASVAEATTHMFTALHNLRVDRASTYRDLIADRQHAGVAQQLKEAREGDLPALKAAVAALDKVALPERESVVDDLAQRVKKLSALHEDSAAASCSRSRRADARQGIFRRGERAARDARQVSTRLTRFVKLEDGYIDQLMAFKRSPGSCATPAATPAADLQHARRPAARRTRCSNTPRMSASSTPHGRRSRMRRLACRCRHASPRRRRRRRANSSAPIS